MSDDVHVSIGQVKRDISQLVNRVAYGKERIVLTSRGAPKAVIVSLEDYEQLQQKEKQKKERKVDALLAQLDALTAGILADRDGELIDVEKFSEEAKGDLEGRNDFLFDN